MPRSAEGGRRRQRGTVPRPPWPAPGPGPSGRPTGPGSPRAAPWPRRRWPPHPRRPRGRERDAAAPLRRGLSALLASPQLGAPARAAGRHRARPRLPEHGARHRVPGVGGDPRATRQHWRRQPPLPCRSSGRSRRPAAWSRGPPSRRCRRPWLTVHPQPPAAPGRSAGTARASRAARPGAAAPAPAAAPPQGAGAPPRQRACRRARAPARRSEGRRRDHQC
mmetsp:Transcript_73188/g.214536  ORF Transcript_73188/g.214536 Transcript_73188/m.214536 type:complete len:221 (+) Transcript_73188:719-1381(+)